MFDTIGSAVHHSNGFMYFFKGGQYIKWAPGTGAVPLANGSTIRRIGIDGWQGLPASYCEGFDTAFYYPRQEALYFFKDDTYVKWKQGQGVIPMANGSKIRRVGIDGWTTLPSGLRSGLDAILFHPHRGYVYFFKGAEYARYVPGSSSIAGAPTLSIRRLGMDGWEGFPAGFKEGVDAAMYSREKDRIYFFKDRLYARWDPQNGLESHYPRRIGLRHGRYMKGGWPGLSHIISGPMVGHTEPTGTLIWVWLSRTALLAGVRVEVNGVRTNVVMTEPVDETLNPAIEALEPNSCIRELWVSGLSPNSTNQIKFKLNGVVVEVVNVRTPPAPSPLGSLRLSFVSCTKFGGDNQDSPTLNALRDWGSDLKLFGGDNCYYVIGDDNGTTGRDQFEVAELMQEYNGFKLPATAIKPDWSSARRMLRRQWQARNHPAVADMSGQSASWSTWDDHDFAFNNANGTNSVDDANEWVGPSVASQVYRAFWPNKYHHTYGDIRHCFRWGPVHVFVPDARFSKSTLGHVIWGKDQLEWLLDGLRQSDAPVKILVTAGQFLYNVDGEGHEKEARGERSALLDALDERGTDGAYRISGKVLVLSGDVHQTMLMQRPSSQGRMLLEFTNSQAVKATPSGDATDPIDGRMFWCSGKSTFGGITIDVQGRRAGKVIGTIKFEARGAEGRLLVDGVRSVPCQLTWDLETDRLM